MNNRKQIIFQWVFIPLLVFVGGELMMRKIVQRFDSWYSSPKVINDLRNASHIFVGSSRVAAAIDVPTAEKFAPSVNMGRGYSPLVQHYFGLRNAFGGRSDSMLGKTVWIEAPNKVPEQDPYHGGMWMHNGWPSNLLSVMQPSELPDFWKSRASLEDKIQVTLRMACAGVKVIHDREYGFTLLQKLNLKLAKAISPDKESSSNLSAAGGIRTDEKAIRAARDLAISSIEQMKVESRVVEDWEQTPVGKIVRFVQGHGGKVIFFEMPMHEAFQCLAEDPEMAKSCETFSHCCQQWGSSLVPLHDPKRYNEFPDIWHLSNALAPRYTEDLLRKFYISTGFQPRG